LAVVVAGITVVILQSSLERRFPGGARGLAKHSPNDTYRSDGTLAAVSFMVSADANQFVSELAKYGLSDPTRTASEDVAIVAETAGFLAPCRWLHVDLRSFTDKSGRQFGATIVWTGDEPSTFAAPHNWSPHRMELVAPERIQNSDVVNVERDPTGGGAVVTYRERGTGRTFFVARTGPPGFHDLNQRYQALREELVRLTETPDSPERAASAARLHDRATEIVAAAEADPGPLLLQGIAARLAQRFSDSETAFRHITQLWPDNLGAWLELTWTLAAAGRFEQAEITARHAVELDHTSAAALGNLASVLLQSGRPGSALPVIDRALALNPSDQINLRIRAEAQAAHAQQLGARLGLPWYRRLFSWR
jgi:hypothetical protein